MQTKELIDPLYMRQLGRYPAEQRCNKRVIALLLLYLLEAIQQAKLKIAMIDLFDHSNSVNYYCQSCDKTESPEKTTTSAISTDLAPPFCMQLALAS